MRKKHAIKKVILSIGIVLFTCLFSFAGGAPIFTQRHIIDSLSLLLKADKEDTKKVNHLNKLGIIYIRVQSPDSGLYFTENAKQLSLKLNYKKGLADSYFNQSYYYYYKTAFSEAINSLKETLPLYAAEGNEKELLGMYHQIGFIYSEQSNWKEAVHYFSIAFGLAKKLKNIEGAAGIFNNLAQIYQSQDNYPKALEYLLISLKFKEIVGNKKDIAVSLNNLGAIYSTLDNYPEALKSYFASLSIRQELKDMKGIAICYGNIGLVYEAQNKRSEALLYFTKALEIVKRREINHKQSIADISNSIGSIYFTEKKYPEAIEYISAALDTSRSVSYKSGIATSLNILGSIYLQLNDLKAAREYLEKALAYAKEIEAQNLLADNYDNLSKLDSMQGKWKEAYEHHKLAVEYKNNISNEETNKKIVEISLTSKYEKQAEKLQAKNEKEKAIAAERTHRQTIISWLIGGGLFIVVVFAGFVLRSLRLTNKQKSIIEAQKNEVTQQKDIAEGLRHIAEKQKHIVEEKQKEIVDSINYAKRIQTALLTSDEYITNNFEAEHFILFKPKDIVSGDFYWGLSHPFVPGWDLGITQTKLPAVERRKNLFYLVTADCTGHGVPGAFMSMLNISFLNENIIDRGILLPHEILNTQRKEIINALNPQGSKSESKDGMDCILCVYDFNKMLMHFAAANNPLWLIRNNELTEFKADKMPVGKYSEANKSFTLQTIELQKGDVIYTSTDGFADQFGVSNKKLMKKTFKEELLKIHRNPMPEQKQYLDQFFEKWKGSNEQVDDVCVIGVRI